MQWITSDEPTEGSPNARKPAPEEVRLGNSITRGAGIYVLCMVLGGLAILSINLFAHSALTLALCVAIALAAVAGAVFYVRSLVRDVARLSEPPPEL